MLVSRFISHLQLDLQIFKYMRCENEFREKEISVFLYLLVTVFIFNTLSEAHGKSAFLLRTLRSEKVW